MKKTVIILALLLLPLSAAAQETPTPATPPKAEAPAMQVVPTGRFKFENIKTYDDMKAYIEKHFPLGSQRDDLQKAFILQGHGTLKHHPTQKGVEKYLYDINLCSYYIWRWNISADYDDDGRLLQAYLNGIPVFPAGKPMRVIKPVPKDSAHPLKLVRAYREWPDAKKGAKRVAYMLLDTDGDSSTIDDQALIGVGPSVMDPAHLGQFVRYTDIEPWRSIFDSDDATDIADWQGDCREIENIMMGAALHEPQHAILK